ncbi:hypothetical protein [Pseudofulvibacter geojedonensis]|uniref:Peptidase M43 pregnancy-associated plasma-A domain-containing protein n=1 Tax=Pseudofulvibacter geojedonensis TaxID=1123758 RepID=A0ABW3I457_9FLAO
MKNYFKIIGLLFLSLLLSCASCSKDDSSSQATPDNGDNNSNFTVVSSSDTNFPGFTKKVVVFGIPIYAVTAVDNNRLLHAANIMAQYLDNNEDGTIDNQLVLDKMIENNAYMVMWKNENDLNINPPNNALGQDLGNDETIPVWHTNGHTGQFDAALEEVWHIITHAGYSKAYPSIFGEQQGSSLSNAMDTARGGQFNNIPNTYPEGAWYTYDDTTCTYACQATEYFYWAMTSILGAQNNRLNEIQQEWKLNTSALVQSTDATIYNLLTDTQYKFPTVLPDGTYRQ